MRWLLAITVVCSGCAITTVAPHPPRFVVLYDQRTEWCRIQVVQDIRSKSCFVGFQCGLQPLIVVPVEAATCVP